MQSDADKLYAAISAATGKDEFAARTDVELAILCDLADLLSPCLDAEQSAALEVAKQRLTGITEEARVFHLMKLNRKLDQLLRELRAGKDVNRIESINRIVWAALLNLKGLDASTAEFIAEISLEAGLEPAAISRVYKRHVPSFMDPFDAAC
jgi:hypothetical protein